MARRNKGKKKTITTNEEGGLLKPPSLFIKTIESTTNLPQAKRQSQPNQAS